MKAFNPKARTSFVLPSDKTKPEGDRTTFVRRPLTVHDDVEILEEVGDATGNARWLRFAIASVRRGITGWSNMHGDPVNGDIALVEPQYGPDGHLTPESIDALGQSAVLELFSEVQKGESVETVDAGKS